MYVNSPSSVTFRLLAPCTQASDTPQDSPPVANHLAQVLHPLTAATFPIDGRLYVRRQSVRGGRQRLGNLDASESIVGIRSPNWSTHPPADCSSRDRGGTTNSWLQEPGVNGMPGMRIPEPQDQ